MALEFYKDKHVYMLDGVEIPSVSEVTRFLAREVYKEADEAAMERAADKGTRVHAATEALDKDGEVAVDDTEIVPYVKAYAKFLQENDIDWLGVEMITHNQDFYAGTLDRYGFMNGNIVILDIKTTKTISGKHKKLYEAGQNLYRLAVKDRFDVDVEKLFILQLKDDETYKLIELPIDDELALACMSLHRAMKKKRRRRKI